LNGLTKFPDLVPSDFHLFGPLKHHLSAEHFPNDEAVEREVTAWFRQQPKEFYAADFQGLVKRWDKCLNVQGDYVEKEKYFSNQYSCLFKFYIHL
jgi:hypothetical protein